MSPPTVALLADHAALVDAVGELRWREWGEADTRDGWVETTARECGRTSLPVTLVALDADGRAVAAAALGDRDDALEEVERRGRTPWLLGLVVRRSGRRLGIGTVLVAAIEDLARDHGHDRMWVATGGDAEDFYRRCGWRVEERLVLARGGWPTAILTRELTAT